MRPIRITLKSGNSFYHYPETETHLQFAFVISKEKEFLGGFLCAEAQRKLETFKKFGVMEEAEYEITFADFSFEEFAKKLGSVKSLFEKSIRHSIWVSDLADADGTSSSAQSCSDRRAYYFAIGAEEAYNTEKKFPLFLLIANHLAIFGAKKFRKTFFNNSNAEFLSDQFDSEYTRYSRYGFKAPSYYVRALVNAKVK